MHFFKTYKQAKHIFIAKKQTHNLQRLTDLSSKQCLESSAIYSYRHAILNLLLVGAFKFLMLKTRNKIRGIYAFPS